MFLSYPEVRHRASVHLQRTHSKQSFGSTKEDISSRHWSSRYGAAGIEATLQQYHICIRIVPVALDWVRNLDFRVSHFQTNFQCRLEALLKWHFSKTVMIYVQKVALEAPKQLMNGRQATRMRAVTGVTKFQSLFSGFLSILHLTFLKVKLSKRIQKTCRKP